MDGIDEEQIKNFYEHVADVWPTDDKWHAYSRNQIHDFVLKHKFSTGRYILNAGSGGSTYGLTNKMHHIDVVKSKIEHFEFYTVSKVGNMPFDDGEFSDSICVGSVINYCDAAQAIHELSRVTARGGSLILEFESSWGYEHFLKSPYKSDAGVATLRYQGEKQRMWVYSPEYIQSVLRSCGFLVTCKHAFHYLSGMHYRLYEDENKAATWAVFDWAMRRIPILRKHACNVILACVRI